MKFICKNKNALRTSYNIPLISTKNSGGSTVILRFEVCKHLVAKHLSGNLHTSLNIVIKVINKIKSRSLNDRMFRELCHENGEEFERLLHHTEVRWLSKGNCLKRVSELFDTIVEFLEDLSIKSKTIEQDTFYLTDIFE